METIEFTGKYDSFGTPLFVGDKVQVMVPGCFGNGSTEPVIKRDYRSADNNYFGIQGWYLRGIDGLKHMCKGASLRKVSGYKGEPGTFLASQSYNYIIAGQKTIVTLTSGETGEALCKEEDEFDNTGKEIAVRRALIDKLEKEIKELAANAKPNKKFILNSQIKDLEKKLGQMKNEVKGMK